METQVITELSIETNSNIQVSNFETPNALDSYKLNIILFEGSSFISGMMKDDTRLYNILIHLKRMIANTTKTSILIVLPADAMIPGKYGNKVAIRDNLTIVKKIIPETIRIMEKYMLFYEKTMTKIDNKMLHSDFYFQLYPGKNINDEQTVKSHESNKTTILSDGRFIVTTISGEINDYISIYNKFHPKPVIKIPEWLNEFNWYTDEKLQEKYKEKLDAQKKLSESISEIHSKINENQKHKMILISDGNDLVKGVCEIIDQMLQTNTTGYKDEFEEDFAFETEKTIFIGEIKGVKSNVKNSFISQLDDHLFKYADRTNCSKQCKGLLIINHQKEIALQDRKGIESEQIKLAERNKALIIQTITLLNIFSDFQKNLISGNEIIDILNNETGNLSYESRKK